jgi:hypothetical protein
VRSWLRISTTVPITIAYTLDATERTYRPDSVVIDAHGTSWLVEAKADSEMNNPVVTAKRDAAKEWVNIVNSAPNIRTRWGYILASETVSRNTATWDDLKAAAQTHT